ncbi:acyl-phosphate glycerol-3-phosphate acyltransferase [Maricaulis maris MCS10]|uniref:Glycerol-3-phosphate acyltransferase n=1 Tax=Maricaulis maris (strain MCS10) TaxID=394221 RepID=PLSY_MARMM|nr:glycerol-3-phosphate 1-O-acyltransferase PlsY [Maricaulis maris]Q0ANY0.1 RecName: Full=Glycerol-3-phosphate acyltransferase; AltName: Full=Acyl-PO4 G3P acyltransferase; AltName: Full=Acyl-phosphate--glycerol-3-phosphate acyltransferase; AltName: Full=G3P acyltransferase; Short=GPAT; AltName: Full=Lysophosphatidic acid synthase; Short=LPA synthase [Maricaulis maris MCS10]ABI66007.1 acyl-phosphate glycerol-3-phosphate acyltransferase [Maricaulis maris MCS10]
MTSLLIALAAAAGGYLFGSIPFGLVLTRMAGLGDIRAIGSGNIGATNVLRTGRKDLAALTLILDAGKAGIAAAVFGYFLGTTAGLVAGAFAFAGHCFPVWLGFKGGKGVATFVGTMLVVFWPVGLTVIATWLAMAAIFRISSLAALAAALAAPFAALAWGRPDVAIMAGLLTVLIYWLHRANISRLLKGEEPRIGGKKSETSADVSDGDDPDTPAT